MVQPKPKAKPKSKPKSAVSTDKPRPSRADTNRINAQKGSGPHTDAGKDPEPDNARGATR